MKMANLGAFSFFKLLFYEEINCKGEKNEIQNTKYSFSERKYL